MSRSLAAYGEYYGRWSALWERQALLRARACAGDGDLGRRFEELINPLRWAEGGLSTQDLREIRRIKGCGPLRPLGRFRPRSRPGCSVPTTGEYWSPPGSWPAGCDPRSSWAPGAPPGPEPRSCRSRSVRSGWWVASSAWAAAGSASSRTSIVAAPATPVPWSSASSSPTVAPTTRPHPRRPHRPVVHRLGGAGARRRATPRARRKDVANRLIAPAARRSPLGRGARVAPARAGGPLRGPIPGTDEADREPGERGRAIRIAPAPKAGPPRTWQTWRREAHSRTPRSHRRQCHAGTRYRLPRASSG